MTSETKTTRIFLVDDHPLIRRALRRLIHSQVSLEVCGEAEDASLAAQFIGDLKPDLVIMDMVLKKGHGIDLLQTVRAVNHRVRVLMFTSTSEISFVERALGLGANGYLLKTEDEKEILIAIFAIMQGERYLSPSLRKKLSW